MLVSSFTHLLLVMALLSRSRNPWFLNSLSFSVFRKCFATSVLSINRVMISFAFCGYLQVKRKLADGFLSSRSQKYRKCMCSRTDSLCTLCESSVLSLTWKELLVPAASHANYDGWCHASILPPWCRTALRKCKVYWAMVVEKDIGSWAEWHRNYLHQGEGMRKVVVRYDVVVAGNQMHQDFRH